VYHRFCPLKLWAALSYILLGNGSSNLVSQIVSRIVPKLSVHPQAQRGVTYDVSAPSQRTGCLLHVLFCIE